MPDQSPAAAHAFERRAWGEVYRLLAELRDDQLATGDLDRLAVSAYLVGRDDEALRAWGVAHRRYLAAGERGEAARCAFWAGFCSMMRGQLAHAGGWLTRGKGVIGDDLDCPAAGYLLVPALLGALDDDDAEQARALALRAGEIAARFGDADLAAFSMLGHGQALLAAGDAAAGLARLDDVMLSVSLGDVGPIVSGIVYCAVVLECMQLFDLARAAEWTKALDAWCASQPDLVPYRGQCLVHQSQLQQVEGDWSRAISTVQSACERLTDPPHPALGLACYQAGELHRLRGELDAAADAYGRASGAGYQPMPGLALLELAQGDIAGALGSIGRALGEAAQPFQRPGLLAAAVEIFVAAGRGDDAMQAAEELALIAAGATSEVLAAMADQAMGAVLLSTGSAAEALAHLRAAREVWRRLGVPYETAQAAALLGRCCLELGDRASAALEFDYARDTFHELGAEPAMARIPSSRTGAGSAGEVLSVRELEVLALVAAGKTNPQIGAALSISKHTVGRHLENIFAKLGVGGRAAATAYAYEHDLL